VITGAGAEGVAATPGGAPKRPKQELGVLGWVLAAAFRPRLRKKKSQPPTSHPQLVLKERGVRCVLEAGSAFPQLTPPICLYTQRPVWRLVSLRALHVRWAMSPPAR
jgi:hypothetical protein